MSERVEIRQDADWVNARHYFAVLAELKQLEAKANELEQDRDQWRRIAREYESALANRGLL